MKLPDLPSVTLTNGLVVANYSSPHPFLFEDGSILPACSNERAKLTMLYSNEVVVSTAFNYMNIRLDWEITWFVQEDMLNITKAFTRNKLPWNIVITPLPVMQAWSKYIADKPIQHGPFRTGRLVDRLEPKKLSIDKFCVL